MLLCAVSRPSLMRRIDMTRMNLVIAAAMISAAGLTSTLAQAQAAISEPGAFQAANPDRDVLNGGQLTPWGRAIRGEQYRGPSDAYALQVNPAAPAVVHTRRHRQHQ
jgi:hypothetical protein